MTEAVQVQKPDSQPLGSKRRAGGEGRDVESPRPASEGLSASQISIASWGVVGVLLLLAQATYRLGTLALEAHQMSLTQTQWVVSGAWIVLNAYAEGYRAFQKRFSPRVVVRALHLARNPTALRILLAPAYCMAFFDATRRAKTLAWATVAMILSFIILLQRVPQPWRGIVDGGVVIALIWGSLAILFLFLRALTKGVVPDVSSEVPQ